MYLLRESKKIICWPLFVSFLSAGAWVVSPIMAPWEKEALWWCQLKHIFSWNIFSVEIYFQLKHIFSWNIFQLKHIFSWNIFSVETYFPLKCISSWKMFSVETNLQFKYISSLNIFSAEIYWQKYKALTIIDWKKKVLEPTRTKIWFFYTKTSDVDWLDTFT